MFHVISIFFIFEYYAAHLLEKYVSLVNPTKTHIPLIIWFKLGVPQYTAIINKCDIDFCNRVNSIHNCDEILNNSVPESFVLEAPHLNLKLFVWQKIENTK